jgi:tripartite-type tricarboxylate transporter receptor subunit TctC
MLLRKLAALLSLLISVSAFGQAYPSKPIRFIVPNPPGGGTDILSRAIAAKLSETQQWQVVVDNRPGAGGAIGLDAAAKSAPDGYTIVMGETSNLAINPALNPKLPYDPRKDLAPVSLIGSVPLVLVVATEKPYRTLADIVAAAKSRSLTFASSGNGTVGHLSGEILKRSSGIDLVHVPYKGAAPAMTDLIGGQVDLYFASLPSAVPHMRNGKLRAIAVTTAKRASSMPEAPTIAESGYPDFSTSAWYGVLAPSGTPPAILKRLNDAVIQVVQLPEVRARLANDGVEIQAGPPEQFAELIARELDKWAKAVRESGAKVD